MNQLSSEIEDMIKKDVENLSERPVYTSPTYKSGYKAGATKWALMMEEFLNWADENFVKNAYSKLWSNGREGEFFTTSELLILFLKQTKNS